MLVRWSVATHPNTRKAANLATARNKLRVLGPAQADEATKDFVDLSS